MPTFWWHREMFNFSGLKRLSSIDVLPYISTSPFWTFFVPIQVFFRNWFISSAFFQLWGLLFNCRGSGPIFAPWLDQSECLDGFTRNPSATIAALVLLFLCAFSSCSSSLLVWPSISKTFLFTTIYLIVILVYDIFSNSVCCWINLIVLRVNSRFYCRLPLGLMYRIHCAC